MKINKLELGNALAQVRCAVNPKHSFCSHVLIEADEEFRLTATNGSMFVRSNVDAGVIVEPGAVRIQAAKLSQLHSLGKPFDIEQDDKIAHIKCGRSKLKFPLIDAIAFPRIDPPLGEPWFEMDFEIPVMQVLFAAAELNFGRPEFESVCMQYVKDGFILVSTNGYRIAETFCASDISEFKSVLLSSECLKACKGVLGDSDKHKVWIESNQCKVEFDKTLITMRLVDGTFPDYTAIIPKNPPSVFTVNVAELQEALRITTIAEGDKHCIGLNAEPDKLTLWTFSGTYQASEYVSVNGTIKPFKTGINSKFLNEALKHVKSAEVEIHFPESATSCLIVDTDNRRHRQVIACMTPPPDLP